MYSFKNDYSEGCHEKILKALVETNMQQEEGYGYDNYTRRGISSIRNLLGDDKACIHFVSGGTQTNLLAIGSFLRPYEACVCSREAHIATHETGAIEYTGHKIITIPSKEGKINSKDIEETIKKYNSEHFVKPRLLYISNSTELGTVYTKEELKDLSKFCKDNNLFLYVDGARLGSALCVKEANLTLKDMYELTDAFFIGGTKNGALLGEALVIKNKELKYGFEYNVKQKGALLAKGRTLGVQFEVLFKDNLYFDLANHANKMANKLSRAFKDLGYKFLAEPISNQIFPILNNEIIKKLEENFSFHVTENIDEHNSVIRLVTSWATKEEEVCKFIEELKKIS